MAKYIYTVYNVRGKVVLTGEFIKIMEEMNLSSTNLEWHRIHGLSFSSKSPNYPENYYIRRDLQNIEKK